MGGRGFNKRVRFKLGSSRKVKFWMGGVVISP